MRRAGAATEVLFVSTAKMLTHLGGGRADGTTATRLAKYLRPDVLALDDFGLKALRGPGPRGPLRHHPRAVRAGLDRPHQQPGPSGVARALRGAAPRLGGFGPADHRAHFVEVTGPSYRAEQTKQQLAAQRRGKLTAKQEARTE